MTLAARLPAVGTASPYRLLTWLIGSVTAFAAAMLALPASRVDGDFGPVSNDSFYHARRILDAIPDLARLSQFDARMHAPEGSLIVWPWGYDFIMAAIGRLAVATGLVADPMTALAFVAPLAVAVTIALVIGIATRVGLSAVGTALVAGCVALSPLTQILHGVGVVDHHFAEYLAWLAAIWALLRWLSPAASRRDAVLVGMVLGLAPALHTDLFILQIPLVVTFGVLRLRGKLEVRSVYAFAATLVAATLAILVPSLAFRQGRFEFFTLSWFHLYAAIATGIFACLAAGLPRTRRALVLLVGAGIVLALPGIGQLFQASAFLAGDLELLDKIVEVKSPLEMAMEPGGVGRVSRFYTLLIWISPFVLAGSLFEIWRARDARETSFWVACAVGLVLMFMQFRFHNFGSIALYLPVIIWVERAAVARGIAPKRAATLLAFALLAAYAPAIRGQLFVVLPRGNDVDYGLSRAIYPAMADACQRDPGIVLASTDDGHYIRYHTECAVIANNFIITRQHEEKIKEVRRLQELSPAELRASRPDLKYVFVHFVTLYTKDPQGTVHLLPPEAVSAVSPRLVRELVLADRAALPAGFTLIDELAYSGPGARIYARLFALRELADAQGHNVTDSDLPSSASDGS